MSRPVLFLINDHATFKPGQSTAELARAYARRADVAICPIDGLTIDPDGRVRARALAMGPDGPTDETVSLAVSDCAVWVRLNPGRDPRPWATSYALEVLTIAERRGAVIRNGPTGLWAAMSKLSLMNLPMAARPTSFVSADPARIAAWVRGRRGASVIKPAQGTHGEGVQRVAGDTPDLEARIGELTATGPVVAQAFLGRAPEGDVRVHLVDGRPLLVDGKACIVRRLPPEGDFRSNVSAGGKAVRAEWNKELAAVVDKCGPTLRRLKLWHVGLDVVGGKVVEINAFAPGGLRDSSTFMGTDFTNALVDAFAG